MARQPTSCAKGRKFARAVPHFALKILFMIPGSRRMRRESNQDGRTESFLVCLIGVTSSTWAQREARTRLGQTGVARQPNELFFVFLNALSARPWVGSKRAKTCELGCLM